MQVGCQSESLYLQQLNRLAKRIEQKHVLGKMPQKSKLHLVKNLMAENQEKNVRKQQNLILYFINLSIVIVLTYLNGSLLLNLKHHLQLKGYLITTFVMIGFFFAVVSNVQIAPWREVLKLYFLVDSLVPVMISAVIGFYTVIKIMSDGKWYIYGFEFGFPFWVFYSGGNLRVMLAYLRWSRWQIVLFKLTLLGCGMFSFYVGFTYMTGAYKVSMGYDPAFDETVKGLLYLYVFGLVELVYEYFRRLSDFDQTKELKFEYQFANVSLEAEILIKRVSIQQGESSMLRQIQRKSKEVYSFQLKSVEEGD